MTPQVVSVRQNLLPLVAGGRPTTTGLQLAVASDLGGYVRRDLVRGHRPTVSSTSGVRGWASPRTGHWSTWPARHWIRCS